MRLQLPTAAQRPPLRSCVHAWLIAAALLLAGGSVSSAGAAPANFAGASPDGETVFFTTTDQLVPGDTDTRTDVYGRSYDETLARYVTRQISAGPTGGNDAYQALFVGAAADGAKAFFATDESLVSGDKDLSEDVYLRDLVGNATILVTQGDISCAAANCGNGEVDASFAPGGLIPSGNRVFFRSDEQLSAADGDTFVDVYVRDLSGGTTTLVSAGDPSCAGGGCGEEPFEATFRDASEDGTKAFLTTEEQLVAADADTLLDIYQRNLTTGVTTLVSGPGPCDSDCGASYGDASSNGSHVYYETNERLSPADSDGSQDVYDWSSGIATLVSTGLGGGNGADPATFAGASGDGDTIYFETSESLLVADADNSNDVYERDGGVTALVSTGPLGGSGGSSASFEWASPDGSTSGTIFSTNESLTSDDQDSFPDVYERMGAATTLLSTGPAGGNGPFNASFAGASNDGAPVFIVTAESLVSGDTDTALDVYEVATGATTLVSTGPLAGKSSIPAGLPTVGSVAEDGSHAFFITEERVTVDDLDAELDVYDRFAGNTLLVSVGNSAPLGPPTPSQLSTDPGSPGTSLAPRVKGQADPNTSIKLYATADCSGAPVATGTSLELGGAGIAVAVAPSSTTSFRATATDVNGDTSPCSGHVSYSHQSAAPPPPPPPPSPIGEDGTSTGPVGTGSDSGSGGQSRPGGSKQSGVVYVTPHTRITFAPAGKTRARRPVFRFTDSTEQEGTGFRCKVDRARWRPCGSPLKLKRLGFGRHIFQVKGVNAVGTWEPAPTKRRFRVVGR